ncbi:TRAP transporter small permease [Paracoccus tegillarcae]|uniref:TRAP transporter small permease protein n=1 Tax=Paracoccus tegillarcae TaxID=1529068 RepID=A0A2K9EX53_9RHOB|nr:TRAP transporter small permease subunit [Paracoccus tegillarcae]AUH32642.1 TRAP transporter small permease [Paracoccus tegillarcae]
MLPTLRMVTDRLINLSAFLGTVALIFVVATVLFDVIGRAFGKPLYGSLDLTTMAFVVVVFGGMALCDKRGGHISVDLFERHFPPRLNLIIDIVVDLLGSVIFLTMGYAVLKSAQLSVMLNLRTNLLGIPQAWFQWLLAGLVIVTGLALLLRAIEFILAGESDHEEGPIE